MASQFRWYVCLLKHSVMPFQPFCPLDGEMALGIYGATIYDHEMA